jgi:glycosyltransferase involved in cell wall biosynthesis
MYGVSRVLWEHLSRLSRRPGWTIHLIVSESNREQFAIPGIRPIVFPYSTRRRGLSFPLQLAWERAVLPGLVRRLSIDAFFRPNLAWYQPLPCPQAVMIHDLAEFHPDGALQYSRLRRLYRRLAAAANVRGADRVLTVSEHAAGEIAARFPQARPKLALIRNGPPAADPRPGLKPVREACFLSVGKLLRHKNHMTLVKAYIAADQARSLGVPLVFLGGDGNASEELKAYVAAQGYGDRIRFAGYVKAEEVGAYYRRALAFLFPSLYEGFGLPILESMAQGVPVVASNAACLPEVSGEAAWLLDPADVAEWSRVLEEIAGGRADLEARARAGLANLRRFSWDRSAEDLAVILEDMAGGGRARAAGPPGTRAQEETG